MGKRVGLLLISAVILAGGFASAFAQATAAQTETGNRKTILDGVFTAAQAERGRDAYAVHCSSCHMDEDLRGTGATALKGEKFIDAWREDSLKNLFTFIRTRMPPPGSPRLSDETYLDILAHIFATNMFPAGSEELTTDALGSIQIVGKDGPAPLPRFALIEVVGCLAQDPNNAWTLKNVSAPLRTRNEERATAAELKASAARPLGTETFRLVYIDSLRPGFRPEMHVGQKLHATGYLLRNDKGVGLSVTWLEAIAPTCTQ